MNAFVRVVSIGLVTLLSAYSSVVSARLTSPTATQSDNAPHPGLRRQPVVDYAEHGAGVDKSRIAKNQMYDRSGAGLAYVWDTAPPGINETTVNTHWAVGRQSIPIGQCELVLLGVVRTASAHLSNDKSCVYSEYDIHIDEVLKNESGRTLSSGDRVTVEREGGEVRYPNGAIVQYLFPGQGVLSIGGRYLLFVNEHENKVNRELWTGYKRSTVR